MYVHTYNNIITYPLSTRSPLHRRSAEDSKKVVSTYREVQKLPNLNKIKTSSLGFVKS